MWITGTAQLPTMPQNYDNSQPPPSTSPCCSAVFLTSAVAASQPVRDVFPCSGAVFLCERAVAGVISASSMQAPLRHPLYTVRGRPAQSSEIWHHG
jgi:hypothetical protein